MSGWIKIILELAVVLGMLYISEQQYEKRIKKSPAWLRLHLMLHWCVIFAVTIVGVSIVETLGWYTEEQGTDLCFKIIQYVSLLFIPRFFFCYRKAVGVALTSVIQGFSIISEEREMIGERVVKKRDFESLKEQLSYILKRMQGELELFLDHSIDLEIERKKKQYCLSLRYFRQQDEIDSEPYEKKISELRECLERLKWRYEVSIHSDEAWAEAEIYIKL